MRSQCSGMLTYTWQRHFISQVDLYGLYVPYDFGNISCGQAHLIAYNHVAISSIPGYKMVNQNHKSVNWSCKRVDYPVTGSVCRFPEK